MKIHFLRLLTSLRTRCKLLAIISLGLLLTFFIIGDPQYYFIEIKPSINQRKFENAKIINKYVAISSNLDIAKDFYMFYLPVTCQAWRRVGFEPIVILIVPELGERFVFDVANVAAKTKYYDDDASDDSNTTYDSFKAELNPLQIKVIEYLTFLRVKIFYLRSLKDYDVILGMLARIFIGYIGHKYVENENDFVILSDTDLIPINEAYYRFNEKKRSLKCWNAGCCGHFIYSVILNIVFIIYLKYKIFNKYWCYSLMGSYRFTYRYYILLLQ